MEYTINKTAHLLTNRHFINSNYFVSGQDVYEPVTETDNVSFLKNLLQLDNTNTEYYVVSLLSLITNYTHLRRKLDDTVLSYSITDFFPEKSQITGATAIPDRNNELHFVHQNVDYPVTFDYEIKYNTDATAIINNTNIVDITFAPQSNKLFIEWPEDFIYKGAFKLPFNWNSNSIITIDYKPLFYPAKLVVKLLNNSDSANELLIRQNLLNTFLQSKDNYEKVAAAATALALTNQQNS